VRSHHAGPESVRVMRRNYGLWGADGQNARAGMTQTLFGLWVHGLNKGGLEDIWNNRRFLATEGRFGGTAVRAHKGTFSELQTRLTEAARPTPRRSS
jgi:hypothetical protein